MNDRDRDTETGDLYWRELVAKYHDDVCRCDRYMGVCVKYSEATLAFRAGFRHGQERRT